MKTLMKTGISITLTLILLSVISIGCVENEEGENQISEQEEDNNNNLKPTATQILVNGLEREREDWDTTNTGQVDHLVYYFSTHDSDGDYYWVDGRLTLRIYDDSNTLVCLYEKDFTVADTDYKIGTEICRIEEYEITGSILDCKTYTASYKTKNGVILKEPGGYPNSKIGQVYGATGGGVEEESSNQSPTAFAGSSQSVSIGDTVYFDGTGTDSDGSIVKYEWDFNGDGIYDWEETTSGTPTHVYNTPGKYYAKLRVTDNDGATDTEICIITVQEDTTESAEIVNHNSYSDSYDYFYIVGDVKNTGDTNLKFVKIIATIYNGETVVETDFFYTDLDILTPSQISPFKLMMNEPSSWTDYSLSVDFRKTTDEPYKALQIKGTSDEKDEYGYHYIRGEVKNTGADNIEYIKPVVSIYDIGGKIIETDFTYTNPSDLGPGGVAPFDFMIDTEVLPGVVYSYNIQVQGRVE